MMISFTGTQGRQRRTTSSSEVSASTRLGAPRTRTLHGGSAVLATISPLRPPEKRRTNGLLREDRRISKLSTWRVQPLFRLRRPISSTSAIPRSGRNGHNVSNGLEKRRDSVRTTMLDAELSLDKAVAQVRQAEAVKQQQSLVRGAEENRRPPDTHVGAVLRRRGPSQSKLSQRPDQRCRPIREQS